MGIPTITAERSPVDAPDRPRRRWHRPLAVLVPALVVAFVVPAWLVVDPSEPAEGVRLPASIVGYLPLTDTAQTHPAGPAVLLYMSGNGEVYRTYQDVVVGVDGRSYRRIAAPPPAAGQWSPEPHLAPDGNTVLITVRAYDGQPLTTVDLTTGATRDIPVPAGSGIVALAWSPRLHTVALAVAERPSPDNGSDYAEAGTLTLLDLRTGTLTPLPGLGGSVVAAAWSPDGSELAVQRRADGRRDDRLAVVDVTGQLRREIPVPAGKGLLPSVAWSPDGRWLVTSPYDEWGWPRLWDQARPDPTLQFIDATGGDSTGPTLSVVGMTILGWLGPDRLLQLEYTGSSFSDGVILSALSVADGRTTRLAGFKSNHTCEYFLSECRTEITMEAATLLLPHLEVLPAPWFPDRGPTLLRCLLGAVVLACWLTSLAFVRIRRRAVRESSRMT